MQRAFDPPAALGHTGVSVSAERRSPKESKPSANVFLLHLIVVKNKGGRFIVTFFCEKCTVTLLETTGLLSAAVCFTRIVWSHTM